MVVVNDDVAEQFLELGDKFRAFHATKLNVYLHLLTTPLAVWAAIAAINKISGQSYLSIGIIAAYLVALSVEVSSAVFIPTAVCITAIVLLSAPGARVGWMLLTVLFCVGYFGQDLAHWGTGEETFQSSYQQENDFWLQLLEHTYYLIPLVFDACLSADSPKRTMRPLLDTRSIGGDDRLFSFSVGIGIVVAVLWNLTVDSNNNTIKLSKNSRSSTK
mmetsp:Transcript_36931/g.42125  ORF Transcript_36931/g.42125 Transcript_36931/m.42125 type:complete len:217 (+) Transcript_36931:38-688(+)